MRANNMHSNYDKNGYVLQVFLVIWDINYQPTEHYIDYQTESNTMKISTMRISN